MPAFLSAKETGTDELKEVDGRLFANYGQPIRSPVLAWLPVLLGLVAAAAVACRFCPVPRSRTVSGSRALFLAIVYMVGTVGTGAVVLAANSYVATWSRRKGSLRRILLQFCAVAAWFTPVVAFYMRDSFWAPCAAVVLAAVGARLIHSHQLEIGEVETPLVSGEPRMMDTMQSTSLMPMVFAALLLQFAGLSIVVARARPASVLIGSAIFPIVLLYRKAVRPDQSGTQGRSPNTGRPLIAGGLALAFVAASFTPYLAVQTEDGSSNLAATNPSTTNQRSPAKPAGGPTKPSFLQSARSFFRRLLTDNPQLADKHRAVAAGSSRRPYPALQVLFGEREVATGSESISSRKTSLKDSTAIVVGDWYSGMILRPEVKDYAMIVPPLAKRWVFEGNPNERKVDPVSIPFYGAYWFFRASEKTLPADAVESRGDPASLEFRTTDLTPISMEARQNFGSLIDLSCCKAIQVHISNGDRRPNTVVVELILRNTRLPGQPGQSLGVAPVNSTLRWYPGDDRPPVSEILSFRVPAQSAIQRFDEAIIRFSLRFRSMWSAKIAIEKFRLIPRGL